MPRGRPQTGVEGQRGSPPGIGRLASETEVSERRTRGTGASREPKNMAARLIAPDLEFCLTAGGGFEIPMRMRGV